jgi:hypothetical protein
MRSRYLLLALVVAASTQLAGSCGRPASDIKLLAPGPGDVTTFSFSVTFEVTPGVFDLGTLAATLNGEPMILTGGPVYTATIETGTSTVDPGFPLQDDNVLRITAQRLNSAVTAKKVRAFKYLPPKARAYELETGDEAKLITGPLAHNRIGDYMLENTVARFAIQDANQRDLHSVGQFGGNIIDAALVGKPGLDSFFELQPSLDIETVVNATSIKVVNDGQDGTAAIIESCQRRPGRHGRHHRVLRARRPDRLHQRLLPGRLGGGLVPALRR